MKNIDYIKKRIVENDDVTAFETFYNYYFDKLFLFSLRFLKSKELSEEVVSDVFIKVWENRTKLSEVRNLETYLYVLVKNRSIDVIRQTSKSTLAHFSLDDDHFQLAVENFTPERAYFAEELRNEIDKVVETLPLACKNAFLLIKEDQLSYKEAAKILEISPLTVKKQTLKALKTIREYLVNKEREGTRIIPFKDFGIWLSLMMIAKILTFF